MSKIDVMKKELYPDGIMCKSLGELADEGILTLGRGQIISKIDMRDMPGEYPVYSSSSQNNGEIGRYGKYMFDDERITWSIDGGGILFYRNNLKYSVTNVCGWLIVNSPDVLNTKYLYYTMYQQWTNIEFNYTHKAHPSVIRDEYNIPLPPLSIQQKIVYVLDSFTTLIDKMKQEVEKRKKQMEYYCDQYYGGDVEGMKALANDSNNSVITFAELGTITRGKRFVRDDVRESGLPCIHYGDMYTYYGTKSYQANTFLDRDFPKKMRYAKKGDVVIVGAGENDYDIGVGVVWMGDEPAAVHDACYILEHKQNPMYISYYLRSNIYHQQLKKYVSSGKISSFSAEGLGKVYIPIQPADKQSEIVSTLDKFESYISKLEKMIELRQKQYEYYREQLLTFE